MIKRLLFFMLLIIGFNVYSVNALETLPGDIDGNGKIETSDYLLIRKHLLSNPKLTGDKLKRADLTEEDYKIGDYQLLFDKSYYVILRPDML